MLAPAPTATPAPPPLAQPPLQQTTPPRGPARAPTITNDPALTQRPAAPRPPGRAPAWASLAISIIALLIAAAPLAIWHEPPIWVKWLIPTLGPQPPRDTTFDLTWNSTAPVPSRTPDD